MKTTIILLLVVLSLALVLAKRPRRPRPHPHPHPHRQCRSDKDCGKRKCCIKHKRFSFCSWKVREGRLCGFHRPGQRFRIGCGCRDELVCKKTGYFLKRCVKDEGRGSGDGGFLY